MQVVILKQPLYGTVVWNGFDFIYTPNTGFEGTNDYFTYSQTINGVSKIYTKYVNSANTAPVANNVSLTADAFATNTIPISLLGSDSSQTLGELTIVGVSGNVYGTATTDGKNIYYNSNGYKNVEHLTFGLTDKQYTVTGTLTLSVINGTVINTQNIGVSDVKDSYQKTLIITNLRKQWDGTTTVVQTYSANWDSVNYPRYNNFSSTVENNYQSWNDSYNHKAELDNFYSFVSTNSATWVTNTVDGSATYVYINPKAIIYDDTKNVLTNYKPVWNENILKYSDLNSDISNLKPILSSTNTTVQQNSAIKWDQTDLNSVSANYFSNWFQLSTLSANKLNDAETKYDTLYSNLTGVSANNNILYTTVRDNSASWDVTDLVAVSANYFGKWTEGANFLNLKKDQWNTTYDSTTALSATFDVYVPRFDGYKNVVNNNSNNWSSVNNISSISATALTGSSTISLSAKNLDIHNNLYSTGKVTVSGDIKRYDVTYITVDTFEIYNQNGDAALDVNKIGGGGLVASFNTETNEVLFVEANNTVGVNTLTGNNRALTVGGSISASGYMHPYLTDTINTYESVSATYENVYSALTSSSATSIAALTSSKPSYDQASSYINGKTADIANLLNGESLKYNSLYNVTVSQSSNNDIVNNFIILSSAYIDIDPEFVKNKPKYDDLYTNYGLLTS